MVVRDWGAGTLGGGGAWMSTAGFFSAAAAVGVASVPDLAGRSVHPRAAHENRALRLQRSDECMECISGRGMLQLPVMALFWCGRGGCLVATRLVPSAGLHVRH